MKISIILPVYNGESFLAAAIDSVLSQTLDDFELIIADNASTDATPKIIQSYKDPRIRCFRHSKNLGMVGNWNFGISVARADRLQILCADDYLAPRFLERSLALVQSEDITFTNCIVHKGSKANLYKNPYRGTTTVSAWKMLKTGYGIPLSSVTVPFAAKKALYDPSLPFNADFEFVYRLLETRKYRLHYIDEPLVHVRLHDANETKKYDLRTETKRLLRCVLRYTNSSFRLAFIYAKLLWLEMR